MVEWEVLERGEAPGGAEEPPRHARRGRWRWGVVVLALLALLLGGRRARAWLHEQERQREVDVAGAIEQEEQALRFHLVERAAELAVPVPDAAWMVRYEATFPLAHERLPIPMVETIETVEPSRVLATLRYGESEWRTLRGYRLTLWLGPRDLAQLDPLELLDFLESFYTQLGEHWPIEGAARTTIRVEALDLAPFVLAVEPDQQLIRLNSPLLSPLPRSPLDPDRALRLAIAGATAELLAGFEGRNVEEENLRRFTPEQFHSPS